MRTHVQESSESPRKKQAAGGFGRCCWIYSSPAIEDAPTKTENGAMGVVHRQAPLGRLWRTAMELHMGRGRTEACETQTRQRKAKRENV